MKHILIKDYADRNKISERTVYNYIKDGKLKTKKLGSLTLIQVEDEL